jgi:adenine-specific DNA-methyltransferase
MTISSMKMNVTERSPLARTRRETRKAQGVHYTPTILSDFVATQIVTAFQLEPHEGVIEVMDPATGDGELLLSLLSELTTAGFKHIKVSGFETDTTALVTTKTRLQQRFPNAVLDLSADSFLHFVSHNCPSRDGDLFKPPLPKYVDLIFANPPYVRTQVMGARQAQILAEQFDLSGRVDLYYPFVIGMARILKPGGVAGVIVSNRFMTTKSGAGLRRAICEEFDVLHVWDLGDTRLFEAAVLPAVLLLRKKRHEQDRAEAKFTSIYSVSHGTADNLTTNITEALDREGVVENGPNGQRFLVRQGNLDHGHTLDGVWRIGTSESSRWLETVKRHSWGNFGDIGKIRVGIKTTCDKVFIRSDWDEFPVSERPELLRPLTTHHVARAFRALDNTGTKVLYPHQLVEGQRKAVDLEEFPRSAKYLKMHRRELENRTYVVESGRKWYEIWVPQDPAAWGYPKLVFRDIVDKPVFWMDLTDSVVNGDCYWLGCRDPKKIDLLWLALAVGNSTFIEAFYDHCFHNKLYAGRRRFMTQYVEKFPLPDPDGDLSKAAIGVAKQIYAEIASPNVSSLQRKLDQMIWKAFGLPVEKVSR